MKVWVDDVEEPPKKEKWTLWVRTYEHVECVIRESEPIHEISLCQGLGENVVKMLEERFKNDKYLQIKRITCHSHCQISRRIISEIIHNLKNKGYVI